MFSIYQCRNYVDETYWPACMQQGDTVGVKNTHAHAHSHAHTHEVLQNCDKMQCQSEFLTCQNIISGWTWIMQIHNLFSSFYPFAFTTGLSVYSLYFSALGFPFKHFFCFPLAHGERIVVCKLKSF